MSRVSKPQSVTFSPWVPEKAQARLSNLDEYQESFELKLACTAGLLGTGATISAYVAYWHGAPVVFLGTPLFIFLAYLSTLASFDRKNKTLVEKHSAQMATVDLRHSRSMKDLSVLIRKMPQHQSLLEPLWEEAVKLTSSKQDYWGRTREIEDFLTEAFATLKALEQAESELAEKVRPQESESTLEAGQRALGEIKNHVAALEAVSKELKW